MVGLLHCKLAHGQLFINQLTQIIILRAVLYSLIALPVFVLGIASAKVQDLAIGLDEFYKVVMGPFFRLVHVPLGGISSLQHINCTVQLGVICIWASIFRNPGCTRSACDCEDVHTAFVG